MPWGELNGLPKFFLGRQMTKPTTRQRTLNTEREGESQESDNPSDCCDFGYVLVDSGAQLRRNGVGEARPKPQSDREREFDPADHWGKA